MNSLTEEARLIEFGKQVRERRKALRMSIRKLAENSDISPSYVSAIESGRNPATGRPPEPSIGIVERLNSVLGISNSVFRPGRSMCGPGCQHNHALLYRLDDGKVELRQILNQAFGTEVNQWICISDPRQIQESDEELIAWHWPFGSFPYPDNFLVPDRIGDALEAQVEKVASQITSENYGVVIADCSAVMRWMINPDAEVDYEDQWIERSTEIFQRILGRAPVVNTCVYAHRDLEALAKQIDVLDTILKLFAAHSQTFAVDHSGQVLSGSKAFSAVLADSRPGGISSSAWRSISGAAALSFSDRA
ncbi:MAG: helix-turn-helix transcriptional regulator [Sedimentitalea sp.]|uniref:helix-turn-helix domain-containing protein n=1 Tax=Sedimentitalea sp. TaxID=2048915 RepID=UPI003266EC5E